MSKKDYEKAATIAQDWTNITPSATLRMINPVVEAFVDLFRNEPRFDERRFRCACVPGANVRARS